MTVCRTLLIASIIACAGVPAHAQEAPPRALKGFDTWVAQVMKDWNAPGLAVGVVVRDKLVYAKGYGYRDYMRKLPFTPRTLCPIASNTKLFTATAVGMLVSEGRLEWDKPVHDYVPSITFFNDALTSSITMRDMLSHRTGITRHDLIWYKSDLSRDELFHRLKYLEPSEPIRTKFLYNNLMFMAAGRVLELLTGMSWEEYVRTHILRPLEMNSTVYTIDDMLANPDHGTPCEERRDSEEIRELPQYREQVGVAPCGAIISNIDDMSHWVIMQINGGRYHGSEVVPASVIKATCEPAIAQPNGELEMRGWSEMLNMVNGMGRVMGSYRGHLITLHGGALPGFFSQVSMMPTDSIGVIVLVIGNHAAPLINVITYNVYERMLGMSLTPWSERRNSDRLKYKAAGTQARAQAGVEQVRGTHPSHALADYAGAFAHPAYDTMRITMGDSGLVMNFHKIRLPLTHFHYDRFDTPDDETDGKWSLNFATNPQGEIDRIVTSVDEAEMVLTRVVARELSDPAILAQYEGEYLTPAGGAFRVARSKAGGLALLFPGQPEQLLQPWQPHRFRIKEFSDVYIEFEIADGRVTAFKQVAPDGVVRMPRK